MLKRLLLLVALAYVFSVVPAQAITVTNNTHGEMMLVFDDSEMIDECINPGGSCLNVDKLCSSFVAHIFYGADHWATFNFSTLDGMDQDTTLAFYEAEKGFFTYHLESETMIIEDLVIQ